MKTINIFYAKYSDGYVSLLHVDWNIHEQRCFDTISTT